MEKYIRIILVAIAFIVTYSVHAQDANVEFDKKLFKTRKTAFKEAVKNIKEGDELFDMGPGFYAEAIPFYMKAFAFNPNNAMLNYKIGVCYLNSQRKDKSSRYLIKAQKLNFKVAPDLHYRLGQSYQVNYKFKEAIEEYNTYRKNLSPEDLSANSRMIDKHIAECKTAIGLMSDTTRVFIDNLGDVVNSKYPDYAPLISTDESLLIFTSKRETSTGGKLNENNEYDEDIFVTYKNDGIWTEPMNMGKTLNDKAHNATIGLSPDGQKLFVYMSDGGGDIYVSQLDGNEWTKPKALPKQINTKYSHEASASFSFDNKSIYFSSDNSEDIDNYGGHDIFVSRLNKKGKWGDAVNIGGAINTPYDETDIFMHPDGRTMFFSSNGHNTMGGFDIFMSELKDDGNWSDPINLGHPINTPTDDRFFVLAGSGKHGYYSSAKEGSVGAHDIYMITFLGPEKQMLLSTEDNLIASIVNPVKADPKIESSVEIKTSRLTVVKGIVRDGFSPDSVPIQADIELLDNETGEIISVLQSNPTTGTFMIPLPSGKDYAIAVKKEGYLFHSENFNIPPTSTYQEVYLPIKLLKMEKNSKIVLRNVFFEYGKAKLDPKSYKELDRLITILQDHPNMNIEIGGHTDNKGSLAANQKLSEERAKSVVDYLSKDIPLGRLQYKGYAFEQPVADNATAEGRALNRRVEFKVLSNEE